MELLNALNWRYATKRMTGEKVDQSLIENILEAARLAPTSAGHQPFRIIAITNTEVKKAISPIAFNQPQITESSHLLVFASWDSMSNERIDEVDVYTRDQRSQPPEVTRQVVQGNKALFSSFTPEQQYHHSAKQAFLGLGMALAAAAELGVDSTPMEGFDKQALDQYLELNKRGLKSVALMAIGRRDTATDWLYPLKKVRTPMEEFVIEMN